MIPQSKLYAWKLGNIYPVFLNVRLTRGQNREKIAGLAGTRGQKSVIRGQGVVQDARRIKNTSAARQARPGAAHLRVKAARRPSAGIKQDRKDRESLWIPLSPTNVGGRQMKGTTVPASVGSQENIIGPGNTSLYTDPAALPHNYSIYYSGKYFHQTSAILTASPSARRQRT